MNERSGIKFEMPEGLSLPNLALPSDSVMVTGTGPTVVRSYKDSGRDTSNSWTSVIPWVKANTKLEIWLKGSKL